MDSSRDVPEPSDSEKARLAAVESIVGSLRDALASGAVDAETVQAALNQLGALRPDRDQALNWLHVPADAGAFRDALVRIMARIPQNWGRWISCDAGWYPLITELDAALTALDPAYIVYQVKEKFGALRYYAHSQNAASRVEFEALIVEAEQRSAQICEQCGNVGRLCTTSFGWCKTLCPTCSDRPGGRTGRMFKPVDG